MTSTQESGLGAGAKMSPGEISLSVEETNRLRAQLGLRPLRTNPREGNSTSSERRTGDDGVDNRRRTERGAELPRKSTDLACGVCLPTPPNLDAFPGVMNEVNASPAKIDEDDMVWVEHSKRSSDKQLPGLERASFDPKLKEVPASAVPTFEKQGGIQVRFADLATMDVDGSKVLTLADHQLLDEDGDGLNNQEDVLENVEDRQLSETKRNQRLRKGADSYSYDPTDDTEFHGEELSSERGILRKYDQEPENPTFRIDSDGRIPATDVGEQQYSPSEEHTGHRAHVAKRLRAEVENALPSTALESAYFTKEEYVAKFKQKSTANGAKADGKAKKRRRLIREECIDSNLQPNSVEGRSRKEAAPSKAVEGTARIDELRRKAWIRLREEHEADPDDDEDEIQEAMARARKAVAKAHERLAKPSLDSVLEAFRSADMDTGGGMVDSEDRSADDGASVVINEADHFVPNFGSGDVSQTNIVGHPFGGYSRLDKSEVDDTPSNNIIRLGDMQEAVKGDIPEPIQASSSHGTKVINNAVKPFVEHAEGIDTVASLSTAHAIARFRDLGALNRPRVQEGRSRDTRVDWSTSEGDRDVKLVYADDRGQEVTQKEAFRILSHKFHGKGPGQNKREARMRRQMLSREIEKNVVAGDTPLGSVAAFHAETRKIGAAHVLLSGTAAIPVNRSVITPLERRSDSLRLSSILKTSDNAVRRNSENGSGIQTQKKNVAGIDDKVEFSLGSVAGSVSKRSRRT
jgi:U4/U6.U5 tri-snRNP-associated protein 1